jgi:purine nucleosidase
MEEKVKPVRNSISKFVMDATGYDLTSHRFRNRELIYLHDPLAVGVVIDPHLVRKERLSIDVNTQEGEHYGKTSEVEEGLKVEVCLGVDAKGFLDLFTSRLN